MEVPSFSFVTLRILDLRIIVIYVFPVEGELEVAALHLPVKSDIEDNDNETREAGLATT